MNAKKVRRRYTQQEKSELVSSYRRSGSTQKAWCDEHDISMKTLHNWISANSGEQLSPQSWVPVEITPEEKPSCCVTLQIGKCKIDVSAATDKKLLSEVLEMLVLIC